MPADGEVSDTRSEVPNHVCQDTSAGVGRMSRGPPESVRPADAVQWLGKTRSLAVRGGEVAAEAARAVGKHPLPIPPSGIWFALEWLCQFATVVEGGAKLRSDGRD